MIPVQNKVGVIGAMSQPLPSPSRPKPRDETNEETKAEYKYKQPDSPRRFRATPLCEKQIGEQPPHPLSKKLSYI